MTQHLLIKSFTPLDGAPQEIGTITVLVGPNNAGKSETLRDLARLAGNFDPTGQERARGEEPKTRVVQDVTFVNKLSYDRLMSGITILDLGGLDGVVAQGLSPDLHSAYQRGVSPEIKNILFRPIMTARSVWMTVLGDLMPLRVAYLPADRRASLLNPASATSPLKPPQQLLGALQYAPTGILQKLHEASELFLDGQRLVLDTTEQVQLTLRWGSELPARTGDPVQDALAWSRLPAVQELGHGLQQCLGVVLAMLLSPGRLILLDEPDAGLHPETSRRLGQWISQNAISLGCQVVLVARDPAFLTGLMGGASDVTICRLSRRATTTRFDMVPAEVGKALALFPLFASQQGITTVFREGAVVTPESADRMVYQAVAERVLRIHPHAFLQAQGSRNLNFVVKALKRANIPTCVVADLDLLQYETAFTELVKSLTGNTPPAPWLATRERLASHVEGWFDEQQLSAATHEVESFLDQFKQGTASLSPQPVAASPISPQQANWDRLRRERLGILPPELRIWVEELLEDLKRIGLFISPKGRLEGWISFSADAEDPAGWINRAIQMLYVGECPAELRGFVAEILAHLTAMGQSRRGT